MLALLLPVTGLAQVGGAGLELALTLDDAVRLALRSNRTLLSARYRREVQKFSLDVSADRYRPRASIVTAVRDTSAGDPTGDISAGPTLRILTGGEFNLRWLQPLEGRDDGRGGWTLGFSQPLLKNFGPAIDTAPLRLAHLGEKKNLLSFRDTIADVVVSVITAYRAVIRAHHAITISRESLARAERQIEVNRSLIRAGRMAAREIVQSEAEIANRRLAVVESENGLNSANAALISLLDVDGATSVRTTESLQSVEPVRLDLERSIETVLAHRSDYRRAQLNREEAKLRLDLAQDKRRWDLRLNADVSRGRRGEHNVATGLALAIPFGDRTPRLAVLRAKGELRDAEIALVELRQSIRIAVRQAVHNVEVGFRRVELAREAREFAEQQVAVEREKLAQGLTSTFQLSAVENDLVAAQTRELDATVSYLNALTSLDRTLGKTLRTWGIDAEALESEPVPTAHAQAPRTEARPTPAASGAGVAAERGPIVHEPAGLSEGASDASPSVRRTVTPARLPVRSGTDAASVVPDSSTARRTLLFTLRDFERSPAIDRAPVAGARPAPAPKQGSWGYEFIRLE